MDDGQLPNGRTWSRPGASPARNCSEIALCRPPPDRTVLGRRNAICGSKLDRVLQTRARQIPGFHVLPAVPVLAATSSRAHMGSMGSACRIDRSLLIALRLALRALPVHKARVTAAPPRCHGEGLRRRRVHPTIHRDGVKWALETHDDDLPRSAGRKRWVRAPAP